MIGLVPETDDRLAQVVLVAEGAQARGPEEKPAARRRLLAEPSRRQDPQEVAAREEEEVASGAAKARDHPVGAKADRSRRLAAGASVPKERPSRTVGDDLRGRPSFVPAVVP